MKAKGSPCSRCIFKGYSKELCTLHRKKVATDCLCSTLAECSWKSFGEKAVIGAGIGVAGIFAGLAVLPAFGLKAILGHTLAINLSGTGGALGAGANMELHRRHHCKTSRKKKKRPLLLPKYCRETNENYGD